MKKDLPGTIKQVSYNLREKIANIDDDTYIPKSIPLERLKNWARESYQDIYRKDMQKIITKLKSKHTLNQDDMKLMKRWMIGDLENYAKLETHFNQWIEDLHKQLDLLDEYIDVDFKEKPKTLLKLQGLIMEIEYLLTDIDRYQYIRDRINRFKSYVGMDASSLTDTQRYELANIIKDMLYSPLY